MLDRPTVRMAIPVLTLGFLLAGCARFPRYQPPAPAFGVPTTWQAQQETLGPVGREGWVRGFDDPRLVELVSKAERQNFEIKIAAARLNAAWAGAGVSLSALYPDANLSLGAGKRRTNIERQVQEQPSPAATLAPLLQGLPENAQQAAANLLPEDALEPEEPETRTVIDAERIENFEIAGEFRWEIDLWGRLADLAGADLAEVQAAAMDLRAARLSLAANVAKAYFNALTAAAQVSVTQESLGSFRDTLVFIEERYEVGTAQPLDLRLTRADVANAQAQVAADQQDEDQFLRTLQTLLASYPDREIFVGRDLPDLDEPVPAGLPAELLRRRPDVLAAERRLAATDKRVAAAWKDFLPNISLSASAGSSSEELRNILAPETFVWNLLGDLVQPLFRGGELTGRLRQRKAQAIQAALEYQQTALEAFQEVETALAAETYLRRREEALAVFAEESQQAARLAFEQYRDGTVDILTTLDSRRRALSARSAYLAVRNLRLQNRVNLYLALGGDFAGSGLPPEPAKEVVYE